MSAKKPTPTFGFFTSFDPITAVMTARKVAGNFIDENTPPSIRGIKPEILINALSEDGERLADIDKELHGSLSATDVERSLDVTEYVTPAQRNQIITALNLPLPKATKFPPIKPKKPIELCLHGIGINYLANILSHAYQMYLEAPGYERSSYLSFFAVLLNQLITGGDYNPNVLQQRSRWQTIWSRLIALYWYEERRRQQNKKSKLPPSTRNLLSLIKPFNPQPHNYNPNDPPPVPQPVSGNESAQLHLALWTEFRYVLNPRLNLTIYYDTSGNGFQPELIFDKKLVDLGLDPWITLPPMQLTMGIPPLPKRKRDEAIAITTFTDTARAYPFTCCA